MSIIAEALKKAQEKREKSFEKTSRALEKMISTDAGLIPEKYKKTGGRKKRFTFLGSRKVIFAGTRRKEMLLVLLLFLLAASAAIMNVPIIVEKKQISSVSDSSPQEISLDQPPSPIKVSSQIVDLNQKTITDPPELPLPVLSGIMYSSSKPQAILNGAIVTEGNHSGGYQIVSILPEKIIVSSGEKEIEIRLR